MFKILGLVAAGAGIIGATGVVQTPPRSLTEADFYVLVKNESSYRLEIGVSHSPSSNRRIGRVQAGAEARLKGSWRDSPFVVVVTAKGAAALMNTRGGARGEECTGGRSDDPCNDAVLYTELMTVDEAGEVLIEVPNRLPGPNLRTVRP